MQDLNSPMKAFARTCQFVSGSDLAASTVPGGTNVAAGASFPGLSEPPQRTQTLGQCLPVACPDKSCLVFWCILHAGTFVLLFSCKLFLHLSLVLKRIVAVEAGFA